MIRHIFKIIWNERRTNAWIVLEFVLVFTVLWFCTDFLYDMTKRYLQDTGYDITHTYRVSFGSKRNMEHVLIGDETYNTPQGEAITILDRIKKYPGVENVCLSYTSIPYGFSYIGGNFVVNSDTVNTQLSKKVVTPSFFDVFRIKSVSGRLFADDNPADELIISSMDGKYLGNHPVNEVTTLRDTWGEGKKSVPVTGIVNTPRRNYLENPENSVYSKIKLDEVSVIQHHEIVVRVKPEADTDFAGKFMKDMREQLNVGEYYLKSVEPGEAIIKNAAASWGTTGQIKSTLSITAFLVINIFIGIIGTFWFLTQSRRSEIGLRLALGSSKRKVTGIIISETLIILFLTSIIATIVCLNLSITGFLESMGLPVVYRPEDAPVDYMQPIVNYGITFGVLVLISVAAVWYPARQAAKIQPAEALRDE